jgi:formate/nitrite transporter FocA (FNT family)
VELYGLDADKIKQTLEIGNLFTSNLIPVTIGNIIGGMVFTALPLFLVYGMKKSSK